MADYRVWCPDHETEKCGIDVIGATDARDAVIEVADSFFDEGELPIYDEPIVHVRSPDGEVTRWRVRAEVSPTYHADPVEDEAP